MKGECMDRYTLFGMAETPLAVSIGKCVFITVLNLYFIVPLVYLIFFAIDKVSALYYKNSDKSPYDFEINCKRTIFVMLIFAVISGCLFQHIGIHRRLTLRPNFRNEIYKMQNIDYNIQVQDDGSAKVEHIISLRKNGSNSKLDDNVIGYEFNETNYISDIHVFVNDKEIEKGGLKQDSTYTVQKGKNKNKINISLAHLDDKLNLKLIYFVKDALVRDSSGDLMYYNKFLAYRSGFSYNTNFRGSVNLSAPESFICQLSGYSKDMYVERNKKNDNSSLISFENKPDFEQFVPQVSRHYLQGYDPVNSLRQNVKDFSLTTRANFVTQGPLNTKTLTYIQGKINSLDDLSNMSKDNNLKYDGGRLMMIYIAFVLGVGMLMMLFFSLPFISMYYKAKNYEYSQLFYDEEELAI